MIVDLFAGPGGWDEGAARLGAATIGIDNDLPACRTALTAGHPRIWADVATYPVHPFADVDGVIASPPCQAWSMAGTRAGEHDRAMCHQLADRMAAGDDDPTFTQWADTRSPLVTQPVRWVRELQPRWIALEEVPHVIDLWEHFGDIFTRWGYAVWIGVLNAADYGVPQTRKRVILTASRDTPVGPPPPTHSRHGDDDGDLFGARRLPWVSMADALGWDAGALVVTRNNRDPFGGNEFRANGPSWSLTSKTRSWFVSAGAAGEGAAKDPTREPATTITGKGTAFWLFTEAAATARRDAVAARTLAERATSPDVGLFDLDPTPTPTTTVTVERDPTTGVRTDGVRVSVTEAATLQSFPPDYPWHGSRTKQFEQVGNAIPPLLAAHVLASVGVGDLGVIAR